LDGFTLYAPLWSTIVATTAHVHLKAKGDMICPTRLDLILNSITQTQKSFVPNLRKLNGKFDAGGEGLALHLSLGANRIAQILEVHKTKTAGKSVIYQC
jgi:hypothetical protein